MYKIHVATTQNITFHQKAHKVIDPESTESIISLCMRVANSYKESEQVLLGQIILGYRYLLLYDIRSMVGINAYVWDAKIHKLNQE